MELEKYIIFAGLLSSAIFFFYFILFKRIERRGRMYIISGMLITFYTFFYDFLLIAEDYTLALYFFPLYFPLIFSLYPIIYHYLVSAVNDKNERFIVQVFSFLPVLVLIFTTLIFIPLSTADKYQFMKMDVLQFNSENFVLNFYQTAIYLLFYLQLFLFVVIFIQMYFIHKKRESIITEEQKLYLPKWLFAFISIIILYEVVYGIVLLFDSSMENSLIGQIANFVAVIFVGFLGIKHDEMLLSMRLQQLTNKSTNIKSNLKKENIDAEKVNEVMTKIYELINEKKIYLNPALKLEHLAKKIHIPQKTLSEIINKHENENFSQFINKYRINEAKQILSNKHQKLKINNIYFDVGFYSRSTFNRSFKTIEGITPTEFLNSIK